MNVTPIYAELRTVEFPQEFEAAWDGRIVSDRIYLAFGLFVGYWAVFFLSSLGVVTNSLVMIVFLRQGFRDSVNVSLFSIAVWDQVKCLAGVIFRLDKPIGLVNPVWGINWKWTSWPYLIYLPIFSGYVSYALATYVSIERCLSVSIPFKVKSLITPQLTASFMIVLSLLVFGSFSPVFFIYTVEYNYSPIYNASLASVTLAKLYYAHDEIISKLYKFLGIFYPSVFCTVMVTTSAIIVFHLRKSAENFDKDAGSKSSTTAVGGFTRTSSNMTPREAKVTKMLLVIIFIYLMDFFPRLCKYVASLIEPEFFAYRKYHNLMLVMSNTVWVLDFINASGNFFIFMGMSTNFRKTFYLIFPRCQPKEKGKP
ncbi:peptide receptor GPCR [Elysia marginata]|uniref:Peptide receptor GPCR n=1 Tax=Elysia marginata TaxID=1093978 RepID=A0AAV4HQT9_9GAST|nr:peptide receptor GPCR [Elysia marginata]